MHTVLKKWLETLKKPKVKLTKPKATYGVLKLIVKCSLKARLKELIFHFFLT